MLVVCGRSVACQEPVFNPLISGYCPLFGGNWNNGANTGLLYFYGAYYSWTNNNNNYGARDILKKFKSSPRIGLEY